MTIVVDWDGDVKTTQLRGSKRSLLKRLREIQQFRDAEKAHSAADAALLACIDSEAVYGAYDAIKKWYA